MISVSTENNHTADRHTVQHFLDEGVMSAAYAQCRKLLGVDVYPPAPDRCSSTQREWHAGRFMARLMELEDTPANHTKGRKRLDKAMQNCKDIHTLMWPGQPVPLLDPVYNRHRAAGAVT